MPRHGLTPDAARHRDSELFRRAGFSTRPRTCAGRPEAYLRQACGGDTALQEVEALLSSRIGPSRAAHTNRFSTRCRKAPVSGVMVLIRSSGAAVGNGHCRRADDAFPRRRDQARRVVARRRVLEPKSADPASLASDIGALLDGGTTEDAFHRLVMELVSEGRSTSIAGRRLAARPASPVPTSARPFSTRTEPVVHRLKPSTSS